MEEGAEGYRDVGAVEDFEVGSLRRTDITSSDIWVLRTPEDHFYAIKNSCPHQGAPICLGDVRGTFLPSDPGVYEFGMEYRIIRCPYHGYEYDLETGREAFTRINDRVVRYNVIVKDGRVLVSPKGK